MVSPPALPTAEQVRAWTRRLAEGEPGAGGTELVRALEELSAAATAAQAAQAAALHDRRRAAGAPPEQAARGVGAEIALARRESPARGRRHLGLALAVREMPHLRAAWRAGRVSEWRATLLVRETATLSGPTGSRWTGSSPATCAAPRVTAASPTEPVPPATGSTPAVRCGGSRGRRATGG